MYCFSGNPHPWLKCLDHMICEVPDIREAVALFTGLGFPPAWPIGPFWPTGLTAGVALGGANLEFLQLDDGAPATARIRTLVFEPIDLDTAVAELRSRHIQLSVRDKWEENPELLRLRGFDDQATPPQLICRNAHPAGDVPYPFFLCAYSAFLRERLAPSSFPGVPPLARVVLATPNPGQDWRRINVLFGLPERDRGVDIVLSEQASELAEVVEIISDRGPIDLKGWPARFRFA